MSNLTHSQEPNHLKPSNHQKPNQNHLSSSTSKPIHTISSPDSSIPRISNINLNRIDPKLQSSKTTTTTSTHHSHQNDSNHSTQTITNQTSTTKRPSTAQSASLKTREGTDSTNLTLPDPQLPITPHDHHTLKPRQTRLPSLPNPNPPTPGGANHHLSKSLPSLPNAKVELSPASCMYWSKASIHGTKLIKPIRAHTSTLVGDSIWIFGGTDLSGCFKDVWKLDLETLSFNKIKCKGFEEDQIRKTDGMTRSNLNSSIKLHPKDHLPPPCRAHSATHLDHRIFIFGGGDGPNYFDDLFYLDTSFVFSPFSIQISLVWTKPKIEGKKPSTRRAHATVLYGNQLIIFGGGNGSRALNDVHALDLTDLNHLEWRELGIKGQSPLNRGYHSANLIGSKCVIFGGSDGGECFSDLHILDLENLTWIQVDVEVPMPRLAHTSTQVGSYLFVIGGHDGEDYTSEVKLFNLVTLQWEPRTVKGQAPPRIGYHTTTLHDSRLIVIGGFDGRQVFDQVWCLELASSAYLPQVTNFTIPIDEI
ncbi:hypothetical protein DFH28DRAFT_1118809 [Melampsora americana]|nr:hypothetical protein DFH28DRAFT_1118809 [Melampsora americana]